ncbi:MAG TPA: hypothetical protein VFQ68_15525 [Streptosporangiaceae bacterium]|nr:hypothetical protein [Streptosporangiaceae bacterium]
MAHSPRSEFLRSEGTTGRLHPEIGRLADWSDTATTLTDLYQRRIRGNAVLTIS